MHEHIIVLIRALLDGLLICLMPGYFFAPKGVFYIKTTIRTVSVVASVTAVLAAFYCGRYGLPADFVFVAIVGTTVGVLLFSGPVAAKLYTAALAAFVSIVGESAALSLPTTSAHKDFGIFWLVVVLLGVIYKLFLPTVFFVLNKRNGGAIITSADDMPKRFVVSGVLAVISAACVVCFAFRDSGYLHWSFYFAAGFAVFAGFYALSAFAGAKQACQRCAFMEQQLSQAAKRYRQMEIFGETLSGVWHDFRNHMTYVMALLDRTDISGAQKYLTELYASSVEAEDYAVTGNLVFDSILREKRILARKNNIGFAYSVRLPEHVYIKDMDLCIVLGNILDNALEACMGSAETDTKRIILDVGWKHDYIYLSLENCEPRVQDADSKRAQAFDKGGLARGIGMKNVEAVVSKYDGNLYLEHAGGKFKMRIILKNDMSHTQ